ncbi:UDP-glycosyltransferase 91D1 [Rhynchospora pubera]|uniref:UDP-glycosyltransferase 91D1 n=1 Tax=Rhynchospora pubera TaxID=906938 RepID=A0AAV8CET6_9POAL|nr:UDP-glycosyltransferase 91D1 [Rhynchospora pubera]
MMIQSGFVFLSEQADLRKAEKGVDRPSKAFSRYGTSPCEMSEVDLAFSGKGSTLGSVRGTKVMSDDKWDGMLGRRWMFLGVEMKVIRWPRVASDLASSRNGCMCPKANHGNITM